MIIKCCENQQLIKNGFSRLGYQNYKCKSCGKQMVDADNPPHRPTIGDKPMSNVERQRKHQAKLKRIFKREN
jgi:transposase-like protein